MIKLITINNITITITNNSIINKSQLLRTRKKKEKRGPKILTEILNPPKKQLHKWNAEYDIEIEKIILYIAGMLFIYLFIYLFIDKITTNPETHSGSFSYCYRCPNLAPKKLL